ncbi:MAG: hypothetical protein KF828_00470 [Anaerolineales bacterium]|nr:hypothetical protein [Anaerolineales bacterium]
MTSVLEALTRGLHAAFAQDGRVYLIGEDLLDPYGGAFKVSRGLSSQYPTRVWSSPVSEAAITGVAAGMALRGLRPVVELMFGDFSTLIADQLINSITKFPAMFNGTVRVPIVIRTPMGGRRGYGPTHSQTLEKLYLGVPGLRVLAPNTLSDPGELLRRAILEQDDPVFFVENKVLYPKPVLDAQTLQDFEIEQTQGEFAPVHTLRLKGAPPPTLTLSAYGYMAELAREALTRLAFEHEIFAELVVPTQLAPLPAGGGLEPALAAALQRSGRLLTIEEGTYSLGWGAEQLARASQALGPRLLAARRLAAHEAPIPAARALEEAALPSVADILRTAREMV